MSDCRARGHKFGSQPGHITFVEIDHKIISMVILPILLIQKGQLSVTGVSAQSTGPEVIKLFSCSFQLSMKFYVLINMKMPTIVGIFIFISGEIFMLSNV